MGYEIEFLGANNEPLAYCKAEMSINGLPTSESPWQADENGRIVFPPSLVEQEGKELTYKVVFGTNNILKQSILRFQNLLG